MMQGEPAQDLRLLQPMFVKLRRKFDEIAGDVGARDQRIGHIGQHAVQRMAEFVKQGARIVETHETGLPLAGLGEIQDIDDDRPDLAVELLLFAEGTHPGAATFRRPREIIADEKRDLLSVAPGDRPGSRVGMVKRHVLAFAEGQAKEPVRGEKRGLDHFVELQIGFDLALVDVELRLAALFGIIAPIPRRDLEIAALAGRDSLQGRLFAQRPRVSRRPYRMQKV